MENLTKKEKIEMIRKDVNRYWPVSFMFLKNNRDEFKFTLNGGFYPSDREIDKMINLLNEIKNLDFEERNGTNKQVLKEMREQGWPNYELEDLIGEYDIRE